MAKGERIALDKIWPLGVYPGSDDKMLEQIKQAHEACRRFKANGICRGEDKYRLEMITMRLYQAQMPENFPDRARRWCYDDPEWTRLDWVITRPSLRAGDPLPTSTALTFKKKPDDRPRIPPPLAPGPLTDWQGVDKQGRPRAWPERAHDSRCVANLTNGFRKACFAHTRRDEGAVSTDRSLRFIDVSEDFALLWKSKVKRLFKSRRQQPPMAMDDIWLAVAGSRRPSWVKRIEIAWAVQMLVKDGWARIYHASRWQDTGKPDTLWYEGALRYSRRQVKVDVLGYKYCPQPRGGDRYQSRRALREVKGSLAWAAVKMKSQQKTPVLSCDPVEV